MQMRKAYFFLLLIVCLAFFLRIYKIASIPVSLHGDEIGVGYNAYTLLTEGVDEYGKRFPLTFRADVGPIIFYSTVPGVALFGLTEFGTRFPSAVIGTLTVLTFYFLVKELLQFFLSKQLSQLSQTKIALLGTLFLTISPWHIQISRITHDGAYGLLFQFIALLTFLIFMRVKTQAFFYLAAIVFGISFYAYHSPRLTSPLLFLGLLILCRKKLNFMQIIKAVLLLLLVVLPLIIDFISKPLSQTRFGGINIFVGHTGSGQNLFQWPLLFFVSFIKQFDPQVLFFDTSHTRYFNVAGVGLVYSWFILTIIIGVFVLRQNLRFLKFVFFCAFISVLPGALTSGPVNAGRIVLLLPLLELISALGLFLILKLKNFGNFLKVSLILVISINMYIFLNQYLSVSPQRFIREWQYGVKQIAQYALRHENAADKIVVSENISQAYIYVLFYGKKSIASINQETPFPERHPFVGYTKFGKYEFRGINWEKDQYLSNAIIIGRSSEIPVDKQTFIVRSPLGEPLYALSRL